MKIEVKGLKELERNLLALSDEFGPKAGVQAMRPAMRAAVKPLESTIIATTPRDSGTLADSTKTKIGKPTKKMLRSVHFNEKQVLSARVGWTWKEVSLWNQSLAVEFGTRNQSQQAVLRNAFDQHRNQMLQDFGDALGPAIEKKAKALYRKRAKTANP